MKFGKYEIYQPDEIVKLKPNKIIMTIIHKYDLRKKQIKKYLKDKKLQDVEFIGLM